MWNDDLLVVWRVFVVSTEERSCSGTRIWRRRGHRGSRVTTVKHGSHQLKWSRTTHRTSHLPLEKLTVWRQNFLFFEEDSRTKSHEKIHSKLWFKAPSKGQILWRLDNLSWSTKYQSTPYAPLLGKLPRSTRQFQLQDRNVYRHSCTPLWSHRSYMQTQLTYGNFISFSSPHLLQYKTTEKCRHDS